MSRSLPRYHVQLDFGQLDDGARLELAHCIAQLAPQSAIFANNPAVQMAVETVTAKAKTLDERNLAVVQTRAQLRAELADELVARTELDGAIRALAILSEADAKSPTDLEAMAFRPLDTTRSIRGPQPPEGIDVHIPKRGHGHVTVSAHQSDDKRRHYEVEVCPYGSDAWTRLIGHGKTRTVKGASGAQIWVRFATVKGEVQSEWCTPVLVTIP
jgi:hypothetical protein